MSNVQLKYLPYTWKQIELGEVCKVQGGYAFKSSEYLTRGGYPLIRISNITGDVVEINENTVYISDDTVVGLERFLLQPGDILIAMSGATTGKIGVVPQNILPAYLNQRVGRFVPDKKQLDNGYLRYFVGQSGYISTILTNAFGSAIPNVSPSFIESLYIPLPPLDEQKRLAAILSRADRLRRLRRYAHKLGDNYLQSVFLEMFGDPVSNPRGGRLKPYQT